MKIFVTATALAVAWPAAAQMAPMHGHDMPRHAGHANPMGHGQLPAAQPRPATHAGHRAPAHAQPATHAGHQAPAQAQPTHASHQAPAEPHAVNPAPAPATASSPQPQPAESRPMELESPAPQAGTPQPEQPMSGMEHGAPEQPMSDMEHGDMQHDMLAMDHAGMEHAMTGAYGPYPMTREASGTSWQPDSSVHGGIHGSSGNWSFMGHAIINLVYDWQEGPRGGEKTFVSGMVMGSARRDFANGNTLQLRAMLSPDPFMGRRGYPLHLAAGETADGVTPLVDRQHPHDHFMELSASYSFRLAERSSLFLYAGLPGEPAFGPPAFMHRMSILDSPEAPITHHWLDSTHITFGVVTAGLVVDDFKIEASRFHGREPDEHRYDIEAGDLDSTSLRLSWNPTPNLALQASWAHLVSPEQLEPDENQTRWSASAIYTRRLGERGWWSTTLAWGRRSSEHEDFDAVALESAVNLNDWTLFGRAEFAEQNELLFVGGRHGPTFEIGKVSLGLLRDFSVADHVRVGIGGLYALNFVPPQLDALYDGDPSGAMLLVRFKID